MLIRIMGEYGYMEVSETVYRCFGGKTWQGLCFKADRSYWLDITNFENLPLDFPLYASEYALEANCHNDYETKEMLIKAAKETLRREGIEINKHRVHYIICQALEVCDWQSCLGYIYNELFEAHLDYKELEWL